MALAKMSLAKGMTGLRTGRILGAIVWMGGAYATALVLIELGLTGVGVIAVAVIVQAVFTFLESRLWQGQVNVSTLGALVFDVLTNAAGVWFLVLNIEATGLWAMIQTAFGFGALNTTMHFIIACVIALALSVAPETLWKE